ncbi:MAG: hypothetical protein M1816_007003 [Peltula sp. TS41687]|nr:MAG: hypothetical protein M1816_007003 [Peltula sp. TS41687]
MDQEKVISPKEAAVAAIPGSNTKLRELGSYEQFRVVMHRLGFHYNVAVAGRYTTSGSLDRRLIFLALRQAINEHPALGVTVSEPGDSGSKPHFIRLEKFDLSRIVSFVEVPTDEDAKRKEIDRVLSEQNSLGFEIGNGLPLWRILVLQEQGNKIGSPTDLIFVWHHVIADGRSGLVFHSTILKALNSHASTEGASDTSDGLMTTVFPPARSVYPAMEQILTLQKNGVLARISHSFKPWIDMWLPKDKTNKWSGSPYLYEPPVKTLIRQLYVPAESLVRLEERCHSEKTSITALLQTAIAKILMEMIPNAEHLRCAVAISLRRFIPPKYAIDESLMGLWISAFHVEYFRPDILKEKQVFPWDVARKSKRRIEQEIAKGDNDLSIGAAKFIKDFRATLMGKIGKKREDSFAVTNLGVFDGSPTPADADGVKQQEELPAQDPWRISKIIFSQSCHVSGSAIQFCVVSTKGRDMTISLSWQEGVVSVDEASRVAETLQKQLLNLANPSNAST